MSNVNFILAQFFGVTATLILCLSYVVKNKKAFLLVGLLGDIVYGLTFVFVNSWGAGIITLLSCMQYIFVLIFDKKQKTLPKPIAFMFIIAFIVAGTLDFTSYWDIIPIITYIWFTIALYFEDISKIRLMYLIANMSLAVYDVMVTAYANAFEDSIESIFLMSMVIVDLVKSKKKYNGRLKPSATLSKINLLRGVIGVKNFDLQSATARVQTSEIYNKIYPLTLPSVTVPCLTYKYG